MRALLLLLASAAAIGLAACGGDDNGQAAGPLTIEQRVVTEDDAPDSDPDPVEKPKSAGPDDFVSRLGEEFINPTPEEIDRFEQSDFVQAYRATRFEPESPGGPHSRTAPHISSLTMQFGSEADATDALETLKADSARPCPETCAEQAEEFDVDGIDGAYGTHRFATAESIEETGDPSANPFDGYEIGFADGDFAYRVIVDGPPGVVTQEQAEEIVKSLYERVKGAPTVTST